MASEPVESVQLQEGDEMLRADYKTPLYEKLESVQVSRGNEFGLGIGFVF